MNAHRISLACATALFAAGCATQGGPTRPEWLVLPDAASTQDANETRNTTQQELDSGVIPEQTVPSVTRNTVPSLRNSGRNGDVSYQDTPQLPEASINVTLPPQPLPVFINTIFSDILEQPFSLGPNVAERQELISLRSVNDMAPATFLALIEQALQDYGLGVTYNDGLFRIVELSELRAQMPRFIRARAHANVPSDLRPVVQFVELQAIDAADMQQILQQAFPDRDVLTINNNRLLNTLTLSGLAEDVNAAMSIVQEMDELRFAGTQVVTVRVRNWDAAELAASMSQIMTLEGYMVGVGVTAPRTLTLLPLDFTNQVMIFAASRDLADRALALAVRLDREAFNGEVRSAHVYQAQNTEATALAEIIAGVMGATGAGGTGGAPEASSTEASSGESGGNTRFENITVDEQGNRVIYYGTQAQYDEFVSLARQLDTPVPEVMIEVTIAEVTLTDDSSYGLDAVFDSEIAPTFSTSLTSNGSFSGTVRTGQVTLNASATANNSQVNVLSTPRIVARSGTEATVQVGNDVPIITTQRAANSQSSGSTDVLQTVQYRSTGVLLSVTPRVYSGNRIDLEISQETSAAEANNNSAISSPLISTRSMNSQLSLQDGQTAVLGGLIENRFTRGNSGIPLLKDVPILGTPFRSETLNATRTMLVVLVTPFVLDTRNDRQQVVDTLVRALNDNFHNQTRANGTLLPPSEPFQIRAAGGEAADQEAEQD
ncbi:secretin N-terminal domain-containing protein [Oceanicaulis alexandrii]|uniref:secretin N-terminal domain-containing protein n=1 Tax=Oceanicaulis alexandrii TaxID=153233 RepID=UPI000A03CFF2|nr:secretin N-terminal domain-containing protein [Oceanicaulis alexandrii]